MRLVFAVVLACLLLAAPASATTVTTYAFPGAALSATSDNASGGLIVTNNNSGWTTPRGQVPDSYVGAGKPCFVTSGGIVCPTAPASVTYTGGNGVDHVYLNSAATNALTLASLNAGGGNDHVWIGGKGGRGPIDGGPGTDTIAPHYTFNVLQGDWTIDLAAGTAISNSDTASSFDFVNFENVNLRVGLGAPRGTYTVYGTEGPNTISGGGRDGKQAYYGRGGNDEITADSFTAVTIDGGAGDDIIWGGGLDDVITGGPGNDTINCGDGVDLVTDPEPGDTIHANCEMVLPAPFDITRNGRGEYTFRSRIETSPVVVSWDFGNGKTAGDVTVTGTTYDKPGTYSVVHRATDLTDVNYRTTKTLTIPAPELDVSVTLDEAMLSGGRMPLDQWVDARVRVASTGDEGVGDLSGLRFTDALLKATGEAAIQFDAPADPGAFSLAPGTHRDFTVRVKATTRGEVAFSSAVTGKDAAGANVADTGTAPVRAGQDLEVAVTATPAELNLEVDATATPPRPIKKPVTIKVRVRNVSGQPARNLKLDLLPAIRDATGYNPAAPFPLQLRSSGTQVEVRDLANGEATDVTFEADAANKAIVDVRAVVRGLAVDPNREIAGNGVTDVRIDQPKLISLTATGPAHVGVKVGQRWTYTGEVENLSPNRAITVFVFAKRSENVVDGQLSTLLEPGQCTCGVFKRLEPGERLPVYASMGTSSEGGSRGMIDIGIIGTVHERTGDVALTDNAIVIAPGADHREASIDLRVPANDPFSVTEAAWLMTDSAARAFGARVQGTFDSAAAALAAAQTFAETPKSLYLQQVLAFINEEVPEAVARTRAEVSATLQEMAGLTAEEALAVTDQALTRGMTRTSEAWNDATWQEMSVATGTLLGTLAPDLALEAAMPALAACKLLKYGGKTAMLRRAEQMGQTRAGRLLAKGIHGLVPGDEISDLLARKLWGIDGKIDAQLLAWAKHRNVVIAVRERSPGSIRRLAEGMLPKWEKVKAKNVTQLDVDFLGFHDSHMDTAMLKQMPEWSAVEAKLGSANADTRRKVRLRWEQRKKEWEGTDRASMEAYGRTKKIPAPSEKYGVNPTENGLPNAEGVWKDADFQLAGAGTGEPPLTAATDGLPVYQPRAKENGRFRAMTGDMDPIAILDEKGQILDLERRLEIYQDMAKMGFQHPESLTWDNAAERAKYLYDFDLANGDGRALLAYGPDGKRRAVYFDSRKSRLADGLMTLVGTDMVFETAGVVAGDVPLIPPDETEEPVYITPGGEAGANLSSAAGTRLIRRNLDGTFEEWTEAGGWQPYTLPAGETVTTVPQTSVRTAVAAGETRIDINEASALILAPGAQAWFAPGDLVVLDPGGPNEEYVRVAALGSIITTAPLQKAHRRGELVAMVPRAVPVVGPPPVIIAPVPTATPAPPTTKPTPAAPRLVSAKLAKKTFKRKQGTKLSLVVSAPTTVTATLTRASGKRNVAAGTRTFKLSKTKATVVFGKGLKAGKYTVKLRTQGGNPLTLRFTVR